MFGFGNKESEKRMKVARQLGPVMGEVDRSIRQVVVFGSAVSGDAEENADIDMLLITSTPMVNLDHNGIYERISQAIGARGYQVGIGPMQIDVNDMDEFTFQDPSHLYNPHFVESVRRTHKIVYKRR